MESILKREIAIYIKDDDDSNSNLVFLLTQYGFRRLEREFVEKYRT